MAINNPDNHYSVVVALHQRNIDDLVSWLESGFDANYCPKDASFPVATIVAAERNYVPGLEALCRAGGNVNITGYRGITPLIQAASSGSLEAGRWLIRNGANVQQKTEAGENALACALWRENLDFADMILHETRQYRDQIILDAASRLTCINCLPVQQWMIRNGVPPDCMDALGRSWLRAAVNCSPEVSGPLVQLLISAHANVNFIDVEGGTPLHEAHQMLDTTSLLHLLRAGADPDIPNKEGDTVRSLIHKASGIFETQRVFIAWEASQAAEKAIREVNEQSTAKHL